MFDRAVFRRSNQKVEFHLDIGQLAETLLYYGKVDLLLDMGNLGKLLRSIGPEALIRLVKLPSVQAIFVEDDVSTLTNTNGFSSHKFIAFSVSGEKAGKTRLSKEDRVREIFRRSIGLDWRQRKQADFLCQYVSEASFGGSLAGPDLIAAATRDIFHSGFPSEVARVVIEDKIPGIKLPKEFRFEAVPCGDEFIVDTDLDFSSLSREYENYWPNTHSKLDPALILTELVQSRASIGLSANLGGDILTTSTASKLIDLRVGVFEGAVAGRKQTMREFSEWVLDGRDVGKILQSGERNFHEFLDLLEEAEKFRGWVSEIDDEQSLAKEYFRAVGARGWLEKVPSKALKYMAFAGSGLAAGWMLNPIAGVAVDIGLSAADSFLIDRFMGGWKPNHFVDRQFKKFLKTQ